MKKKKDLPWPLIIFMLAVCWPVGVFMMLAKIFGEDDDDKKKDYKKSGYRIGQDFVDVPFSSSDEEIGAKLKPRQKRRAFSLIRGKLLRTMGLILAFIGGMSSIIAFLIQMMERGGVVDALMLSTVIFLAVGAPGLGLTFWGQSLLRKAQRYNRYSRLIGDSKEVSLDRLAGAMGLDFEKVCQDLHRMMDLGCFEGYHVDIERRVLSRGRLGTATRPQQPAEEKKGGIVHPADRIAEINGTIRHAEVSQKISRLETLTRRIYNYTEAYPEKDRLARSFKDRYLPQTIKILESYSRFEKSGSTGENVRMAMKDIEKVLDVLIASFEKQLDMLYMDEAIDITTDIDALESMLAGDGLGESPFAMGQGME